MNQTESKKPTFGISLLIVAFLFIALVIQVVMYGSPDIHLTLVFASAVATLALMLTGTKWKTIEDGILHGCGIATIPMLILMFIGMLIPAWIAAGTIPTLIYIGLKIISPTFFLLTAALVCSMASIATGSSYTTGATFGVAFMGISLGLGIPAPITAGAVISGAIIGDKLSPLSDSTNLAAGVSEANLFEHIKSMFYTTIPAFIISIVLYTIIGFRYSADNIDTATVDLILDGLASNFNMSPLYMFISLLPMVAVVTMAVKKINALAAMVIAAIFGMFLAMLFQGRGLYEMMGFMNYGFSIDTGIFEVNKLLNRGGIQGMMWTVSLGYLGLSYGGILEKSGVLETLLNKMASITNTPRKLIITHVFSAIAVNMLSASQYVAIMIPGRMYLPAYKKLGIKTSVASRTCEDSGTVTSPLVPWGLCGVYFAGVLGVATLDYLPYTFLALFVPVIAILYAITGKFIFMEDTGKVQEDDI
ncbi:MAG: Na+/H+ antiporter NhaC [Eubacteriales bacterium]|jgi:NhaC family Na+:H+ antiporter|nr:Na+/H+ antiporter NhaC [Eubacteriales bacterium]MDD3537028.1 Na+/H+ antiporter NhaC [Eubacteriales bacterium]MDD4285541.1 Na+/H+ antiporter NhaC [Eubacteriales bacterium]NLV69723.1 Na+/H+ antiporter NhaC [Clostridiales bacterium]HPF19013.1 Na+/H+ antiporter NhaC [Bacillota bacterium]